ncbi:MAG TPA: hypothetical protein VGG29_02200 [Caulobacteraceae bacterium]|jgi:hypothetical protein
MRRRALLGGLAGLALAPAAVAAGPQRVPLGDAFLFLQPYWELPPAQRDRFTLAYLAVRKKQLAPDARAVIVGADGARTPIAADANSAFTALPSLAQLKSKARFEFDGPPFTFALELRAALAPAERVPVAELAAALAQVNAALETFAEGAAVPKMTAAYFPGAGTGQALAADGAAHPLPIFAFDTLGPTPYLEPAKAAGAVTVALAKAPTRIVLAGRPKRA